MTGHQHHQKTVEDESYSDEENTDQAVVMQTG